MKKILGISLVAVLAVSPLMANAAIPAGESGLESNGTNVAIASAGKYYAGKTITDADRAATASAAYVKGAYNDAISAVNKVAEDAAAAANAVAVTEGDGIDITNNVVSVDYTSNGGLTVDGTSKKLEVVTDGSTIVKDSTSGALGVKANTFDAYGAAGGVQSAIEGKLDDGATGYDINAKTLQVQGIDAVTVSGTQTLTNKTINADNNTISELETDNFKSGVIQTTVRASSSASDTAIASEKAVASAIEGAVTDLGMSNYAKKTGVENTIETATITADVASQSVSGYVPVMVNWGDSTANNTSAVALAGGATAGGTISSVSISATYAEPAQQPNG